MSYSLDLIALVADGDAEWVLRTLLQKRTEALGIRPVMAQVIRAPGRDADTFLRGPNMLRPYINQASYALVMLDREGSGREAQSAEEMEEDIETRLRSNGWRETHGRPRAAAIVLDPELEVWVWCRSPHVPEVIGLPPEQLHAILSSIPVLPNGKPLRPKETLEQALRESRRPFSSRVFQELAEKVSLQVTERAFDKLRRVLVMWFGQEL